MGVRRIIAVSAAVTVLLTAPGAAYGALPERVAGAVSAGVDDPPDDEFPSDPEELPPPPEASILEKEKAGLLAGIPASSWEEYAKGDYQFVTEMWRRAVYDTEVRAGAELAIGTYDPETQRCDACTTFIRTNVFAADDRDQREEVLDRTAAHEARYRRQAVADMVDYRFADAAAIGSGDRNFAFNIWEHLRATKPWAARSIAAAAAAVTASPDARIEFLNSFGTVHFYPDQADHLDEIYAGDQAARAEADRRAKRKLAGIAVGIAFGPAGEEDESWYLVGDSTFLYRLLSKVENDPFYKLTKNAIDITLVDEGPAEWREFINTKIHEASAADEARRRAERYAAMEANVVKIRDDAYAKGFKNRAVAADAALVSKKLSELQKFLDTYDGLAPDGSDVTALYDNGTAASALWVFGYQGRGAAKGTARKVWNAPIGWRATSGHPINGEFDGQAGKDAAVLYKLGNFAYRLQVFGNVDKFTGTPRTAWTIAAGTTTATSYNFHTPVAADINGDGRTDVAVYGKSGTNQAVLMILWGQADGSFRQQINAVPAALEVGRLVAGDVNGDRKADLVTFVQHATKGAQMWLALGSDSGFATAVERWSGGTGVKLAEAIWPVMGDFDKDGRAEVITFRKKTATTAAMWMHDNIASGTVSFQERLAAPAATFDALTAVATDVNADGRIDVVVMRRDDATKASLWTIRAKSGGFDAAVQNWTSAKGAWRTSNTRISR